MSDGNGDTTLVRALSGASFGLGGHGAALLGGPPKLVWTRVAGDVLDMAVLMAGVVARGPGRRRQGAISTVLLSGIAGLDLYTALRTTGNGARRGTSQLRAL